MIKHSLSRQLFTVVACLTVLLLIVLGAILLPSLEQRVRDQEQKFGAAQLEQARLVLDVSAELSTTIDEFVLENNQSTLDNFISPVLSFAHQIEAKVRDNTLGHNAAIQALQSHLHQFEHSDGSHYWLATTKGEWIFHPHGQPSERSEYHRTAFRAFIDQVVLTGHHSQQLPWEDSLLLDTKPIQAHYLATLDIVLGIDFSIMQLPNSPYENYNRLGDIILKFLESARFGEHGQVFYFFSDLEFQDSRNTHNLHEVLKLQNPVSGNSYLKDFQQAAKQGSTIELLWDHEDDPGHYKHPALAQAFYVPSREVYLVSISYPEDINRQAEALRNYILAVLCFCLLLALSGAWWLAQRVVSPISKLSQYAQRVGRGELNLRSQLQRDDELGILAKELNNMVEQLESTIANLDRKVQERTAELDQQNHLLSQSLEDKEALLREIHHRVKNNLAIIIGFIQLQQRRHKGSTTESLLKDLRSRIYTIELIHNQLYKNDSLSHITPEPYYRALTEEIWNLHEPADGISYSLKIDLHQQPLEQMLTCGQIINELLSNSLKHAFSDKNTGQIFVSLCSQEGDKIKLVVKDNGRGLNDHSELPVEGLGVTLLQHLVQSKLKGEANWKSTSEGLCWEIVFPDSSNI